MDDTESEEENGVFPDTEFVDHTIGLVEDQIFTGFVESLTDEKGVISFFIGTKLTKAQFSLNNVVVDGMKLTRQVSLMTLFKLGMSVNFSVKYSKSKGDINFKAIVVEVNGPLKYEDISVEEIKYVHNKVFCGKIKSLNGSSGTIVFELDNRVEIAAFYKGCVYVSDKKVKGKKSILFVGMPVCLMVVRYSGVSGCTYMATVVRTELESECLSSVEEKLSLHHRVFYGNIKTLTEKSGMLPFQGNNMEKKVVFSKRSILVNTLKLVKNISLLTLLKVDMPVAFMVDNYNENHCSFVARSVEVLLEVDITRSYSGLLGTVISLTALSGTITFKVNDREKVAVFFRMSVVINGEKIVESASLHAVLKIGLPVSIDVIPFKGKNFEFIATAVEVQKLEEDDAALFTPVTDAIQNVIAEEFSGTIQKVSNGAGIVEFHIYDKKERAIFFRKNVIINEQRLSNSDSLLTLLQVSMPVLVKITRRTNQGFKFEAVSLKISQENDLFQSQSANISQNDTRYCGTVQSLTKSVGIITFCIDDVEEKAIMFRTKLIINDIVVTKDMSLLSLLSVGMPVTFKAIDFIDNYNNCTLKVTHLETESLKSTSPQNKNFSGTIESLTDIGGSVSFQMNNENRQITFSKENVYILKKRLESHVALSSVLNVGMPVSFRMAKCNGSEEKSFEAASVTVKAISTARTQEDSGVYHGTICHLKDTKGTILFEMNGIENKAVFFKNNVRICNLKVNSGVSLLTMLKVNMLVALMVEEYQENKRHHFRATVVHIESTPLCYPGSDIRNCFLDQLYNGIVLRVKDSCGVIEFSVNGQKENAIFLPESSSKIKLGNNVSLLSVFQAGVKVLFKAQFFTGLSNCNYFATAVEKESFASSKDIQGTITSVETVSGVVTFQKEKKQQKAVFYKNSVLVNGVNIPGGISLSTVLRVGMCVAMKVKKFKDKDFNFKAICVKVNEDFNVTCNIFKVSSSKHITCGLGTVTEIVSASCAQLQFELDGQHLGLFQLSDFFVDGQRCDNSQEFSAHISKGDVYCFDATNIKNKGNVGNYLITCVWQGKKPGLLTVLEPYRALFQDHWELPRLIAGSVIALFPPQAAIVDIDACNAVVLFVNSVTCEDGMQKLTEKDWIQDSLSVGDRLTVEVGKKDKLFGLLVAKCAWKNRSNSLNEELVPHKESKPSCTVDGQPLIAEVLPSNAQILPVTSLVQSPSLDRDLCLKNPSMTATPVFETDSQVFCGTITTLASYSGTIEIEVENKKEMVVFTKNDLHINKDDFTYDFSLSSILEVGMPVSVTVNSSGNENHIFKVILVEVLEPALNINS